ncbi:uncharacterized protein [Amphiura filiformis]|uniref:uncharacterized protein n=1 Tax=Amphiura filiformis TaxID=82378 RepID=UPI003B22510D
MDSDNEQNDLCMELEYERDETDSETESESESSEEDDGEVGEYVELEDEIDDGGHTDDETTDDEEARIRAWQYEPVPQGQPGENVGDGGPAPDPERLEHRRWCQCNNCYIEPSFNAGDCKCCREIPQVVAEAGLQGSWCITDSEAFEPAILHPTSLYIGWMEYTSRWRRAAVSFADRNNEKYRYVGYRKFVRWCWGYLGKDIRVQLPACVHSAIMRAYPDGRNNYKGTVLRVLRL